MNERGVLSKDTGMMRNSLGVLMKDIRVLRKDMLRKDTGVSMNAGSVLRKAWQTVKRPWTPQHAQRAQGAVCANFLRPALNDSWL